MSKDNFRFFELLRKSIKASRLFCNSKFRHGLRYRIGAAIEHRAALKAVRGARTIVDIGANIGQFSLLCSSLYPEARIYAFEPLPGPADRFARLFAGFPNVTLFRSAVGTAEGEIEMHVSRKIDSSSLLPISKSMVATFPGTDEVAIVHVPIKPLDAFLSETDIASPALLKIDVQGSELDVLHGCEGRLNQFAYLCIELSFMELYTGQALCHEVIAYLAASGFSLRDVYNLHRNSLGQAIQADFLFGKELPRMSQS